MVLKRDKRPFSYHWSFSSSRYGHFNCLVLICNIILTKYYKFLSCYTIVLYLAFTHILFITLSVVLFIVRPLIICLLFYFFLPYIQIKMGNLTSIRNWNLWVYVTEKALDMVAFVPSQEVLSNTAEAAAFPEDKRFIFRKDLKCTYVLPSQMQEVPWVHNHFLSVFVEDEDGREICCKQLMHNMPLSTAITVLVYNV